MKFPRTNKILKVRYCCFKLYEILQHIFKSSFIQNLIYAAQKMKFSIKDFFSKLNQIRRKLRILSHILKKSLMENFIFCAVISPKVAMRKPQK